MIIKSLNFKKQTRYAPDNREMTAILREYVPAGSLAYCVLLWEKHPFEFKITRKRVSKLGDYRFHKNSKTHVITVNGDLHPYPFLITYIHEIAHLVVQMQFGNRMQPHGLQWKTTFQQLMHPLLNDEIFTWDILIPLKRHMANPKAASYSDHNLSLALRRYDRLPPDESKIMLHSLKEGVRFTFNRRSFEIIQHKRSRVLCKDLGNNKRYLISKMADVTELHQGDHSVGDQPVNQLKKLFRM